MSKENSNNSIENDLNQVSGGTGFFKKIGNKFKGLFSRKDKAFKEIENMQESPLMPDESED